MPGNPRRRGCMWTRCRCAPGGAGSPPAACPPSPTASAPVSRPRSPRCRSPKSSRRPTSYPPRGAPRRRSGPARSWSGRWSADPSPGRSLTRTPHPHLRRHGAGRGRVRDLRGRDDFPPGACRCEPITGIVSFMNLVTQAMTTELYASARGVFWNVDNGSSRRGTKATREIFFSLVQRKVVSPTTSRTSARFGIGSGHSESATTPRHGRSSGGSPPRTWMNCRPGSTTRLHLLTLPPRPGRPPAPVPRQPSGRGLALPRGGRVPRSSRAVASGMLGP